MCANIARKQFGHEHGRSRITVPSRPAHGGATVRPQDVSTPKRILIFDHPLRAPPVPEGVAVARAADAEVCGRM